MATAGLFSMLGTDEAAMQRQLDEQRAQAFAQQTQEQRLAGMGFKAGTNLGRGLAGAFGVDITDPMIRKAAELRRLANEIDTTTPEGMVKFAQAARAIDPDIANKAAQQALEMQKTLSVITKNSAEQRAAATPAEIQKAQRIAAIRAALPAYKAAGDLQTAKLLEDELNALLPADKTPSFGAEAERYARQFYSKPYADLTQAEMAKVNAKVEETAKDRTPKIINQLPGVKTPGDVTGLRKDIQAITKPYQDKADAANDAIDLADMAIKSNNFAAVSSLSRSLAKAAGDQQITGGDVAAFNVDPSLVGTVSDTLARLSKGRPTVDTLRQLRAVAVVIEAKSKSRIQQEEEQTMAVARASGLFTEPQIQTVFPRRPKDNAPAKTAFTSVKEAEAAKLPKGTIITINGRRAVVE